MATPMMDGEKLPWLSVNLPSEAFHKPAMSYIGIIAKCILETPGQRILLSELYDWILTRYPYFRYRGNGRL